MKIMTDKILLRELVVILFIKVILLFLIWHSFFNDDASPVTSQAIADKFISDSTLGDNP